MKARIRIIIIAASLTVSISFGNSENERSYVNSLGMNMVQIKAGSFMMGKEDGELKPKSLRYPDPAWHRGKIEEPAMWKGTRQGLAGAFFSNTEPRLSRYQKILKSVDLDLGDKKKPQLNRWRSRSIHLRGYIAGPVSKKVKLTIEASGSARVKASGGKVIDSKIASAGVSGVVLMTADKLSAIEIDADDTVYIRLYWQWDGQEKQIVPAEAFYYDADDYNQTQIFVKWLPGSGEKGGGSLRGDYDELPRHKVAVSQDFYISETEVTIEQFRQFKNQYPGYDRFKPYASGISWYDANAFCEWLSKKEGKIYRLPTEAEWEYVCRAGSEKAFSSGDITPKPEQANAWGVKNMHTGPLEWCRDWYGDYLQDEQTDPVGPSGGFVKVIRGGGLDWTSGDGPYYSRSANRAAVAPSFGPCPLDYQFKQMASHKIAYNLPAQSVEEAQNAYRIEELYNTSVTYSDIINSPFRYTGLRGRFPITTSGMVAGRHKIGFRVVMADMADSNPSEFIRPFFHRCVKQGKIGIESGPDMSKAYYRTRLIFPDIGSQDMIDAGWKIGLEKGYGKGHHNSALAVLDNGDLVSFYYNVIIGGERSPDVSIMSMRLRYGSDEWDMPSSWPDFLDANDEGPVVFNDNGTVWLFWGSPRQDQGFPFQWTKSTDNGATWSEIQFPVFESRMGPYAAQPINSAFRDSKGTLYLAVDGSHPPITSMLVASKNDGKTWYDTRGRTFGRHSTFIILDNDVIFAYGGKQSEIDGFHPQNISRDGGRTYKITKSPLPALGGGTRASLIKLDSGRLFYIADMQLNKKITAADCPEGFEGNGAYAAVSEDLGKSWKVRKLVGGNILDDKGKQVNVQTVSYVTACQSPNGMIHAVASHNHPDLHFELNEQWVLEKTSPADTVPASVITPMKKRSIKTYSENYKNSRKKVVWSAGLGENGRYLLDGTETWYYENGNKQWLREFRAGRKIGTETYWDSQGNKQWRKNHTGNGMYKWTVFGSDGAVRAKSLWQDKKLINYVIIKK